MEAGEPSTTSAKAQCTGSGVLDVAVVCPQEELGRDQLQVAVTAFVLLFCIVGLTLWRSTTITCPSSSAGVIMTAEGVAEAVAT
jgi:hypothetical protein